uniref:carbonic anhydrase n=1 Tax=Astrosclera willeyana TaxID=85810 RepID=A6YCJ0_9METZ|nr:astrosclerin-2 [Astrosclera willeyana]
MMAYKVLRFVVISLGLVTLVASRCDFNYYNQHAWLLCSESQCGGNRQSPINIDTEKTKANNNLIALRFNNYDDPVDGDFENVGTTVEFVPETKDATLTNHLGTYDLLQFHFHWGRDSSEGSEHQIDDEQYSAEIQFVHLKQGASPSDTAGDTFSVVAVLCEAADIPIRGVWAKLSPVPTKHEDSHSVSDLVYTDLLPRNRDYYHYEGSLTTPLCDETVQWFVLKNTIKIPKAFLTMLRRVESDEDGTLLTFNFRNLQRLNGRQVFEFPPDVDSGEDKKRKRRNNHRGRHHHG